MGKPPDPFIEAFKDGEDWAVKYVKKLMKDLGKDIKDEDVNEGEAITEFAGEVAGIATTLLFHGHRTLDRKTDERVRFGFAVFVGFHNVSLAPPPARQRPSC